MARTACVRITRSPEALQLSQFKYTLACHMHGETGPAKEIADEMFDGLTWGGTIATRGERYGVKESLRSRADSFVRNTAGGWSQRPIAE